MADAASTTELSDKPAERRLDSWKEIASYLGRDVTTVQRWEKREGMPVHRHVHDKRGSVYAVASELDAWHQSRKVASAAQEKEVSDRSAEAGRLPSIAPPPHRLQWYAVAAIVLVGILATAYFISGNRRVRPVNAQVKSLAVLPFKNFTGDPAQEYFADGMTDALIGRLSSIHNLRVTSRTSVMRFKNPQISVLEIAKQLGVDAIVEGSVMRQGNRIRVTAQLIRAATDEHFWSATYDREMSDVLTLQSELAQAIADRVEVTVTAEEHERLVAARPVSPDAYESYMKGRFGLDKARTQADVEKSITYFDNAIKQDPSFAQGYLGLADAYHELSTVLVGGNPEKFRPRIDTAVRKALELDPNLAQAHVMLAESEEGQWQWTLAEAEFRRAIDLNPSDATAYLGLSNWMLVHGRTDEALALAQHGRELDPVTVSGDAFGWVLALSGRYDDAIRELRGDVALRPDNIGSLWGLGFVLIAKGDPRDAIPPLEKALLLSKRSPGVMGLLVRAYAHAGRRADAMRLLEELKRRNKAAYVPAAAFVNAYLGIDDNEQALSWLDLACKEHSNIVLWVKLHPYFDPLRGDPRFAEIMRCAGLG